MWVLLYRFKPKIVLWSLGLDDKRRTPLTISVSHFLPGHCKIEHQRQLQQFATNGSRRAFVLNPGRASAAQTTVSAAASGTIFPGHPGFESSLPLLDLKSLGESSASYLPLSASIEITRPKLHPIRPGFRLIRNWGTFGGTAEVVVLEKSLNVVTINRYEASIYARFRLAHGLPRRREADDSQ